MLHDYFSQVTGIAQKFIERSNQVERAKDVERDKEIFKRYREKNLRKKGTVDMRNAQFCTVETVDSASDGAQLDKFLSYKYFQLQD